MCGQSVLMRIFTCYCFEYVFATKYVSPTLLTIPGKRFNMDVIQGCDIEGSNITIEPIILINSNLFLRYIKFFSNYVPDSVTRLIVLVYYACCSHCNDYI